MQRDLAETLEAGSAEIANHIAENFDTERADSVQGEIKLAEAELAKAKNTYDWSKSLADRGFLTPYDMSAVHLPAIFAPGSASARQQPPRVERSSSTRSARCRWRRKRSCCVRSRVERSRALDR